MIRDNGQRAILNFQLSIVNSPLVSAVVLNYRSAKDTVRCVQALRKQSIASAIEIIVIDNHSEDDSIGLIRSQLSRVPAVRIVEERENIGYGSGNNDALRFARGRYLLIVNPDNALPPDTVERMLSALRSHPDAGIAGPALVHPDGSIRPSARQFPRFADLLSKRLFPGKWQAAYDRTMTAAEGEDVREVDWLVGACLLMPMELFRKLGGFDERFFLFFEDIDLCRRVHVLGKKVLYLPQVKVPDRKKRLSGSSILSLLTRKTTWIHLTSAGKYFWKWRDKLPHGYIVTLFACILLMSSLANNVAM